VSDLTKPPGPHVGPLDFMSILEDAAHEEEVDSQRRKAEVIAEDRTRNILGQGNEQLTPSQQALSQQMRRVIKGERLSNKQGVGFFSIPTGDRKPR
jgi:hypothetical protein